MIRYIKIEKVEVNINQYQIETKCRTQENIQEKETKGLLKQLISTKFWNLVSILGNMLRNED